jgi:homoaconitase
MSLLVLQRGSSRSRCVLKRCLATHAPTVEKDCSSIIPPYTKLLEKLERVQKLLNNRPLTLAEKILYSHLVDPEKNLSRGGNIRGETYLQLSPQRVAMQDASAQLSPSFIYF